MDTSIQQVDRIRRELREFDLATSSCPIDRRRAQREAEEEQRKAREAEAQQRAVNWEARIDQRVARYVAAWWGNGDGDGAWRDKLFEAIGEALAMYVGERLQEERRAFDEKLAEVEQRCKATPGTLPVVKHWQPETVTYQAEMVSHHSSLYQATRDTAQAPGGSDWICVARSGRDATTPTLCGSYDARESYAELDIVTLDGSAWICRRANPGLPGNSDGWQLMSQRGKQGRKGESITGPKGEKGDTGARGEPGRTIASFKIDDERYRAIAFYENGEVGPELNLRPMYERYFSETSTSDGG